MRQPLFRKLFKLLPWVILLIALPGCAQPGLVQSRSTGGPRLADAPPIVVEEARREARSTRSGWREGVPAALATQAFPPDSAAPLESSPAQPLPLQSNAPPAHDVPQG